MSTGVTRETTTDKDGYYTAPNLLPGPYEISISASGFATQVQKGIILTVGGRQVLSFTMRVGKVNEKVEVTAEASTVELTSSDISAVVDSKTIRELPLNGRSWTDLALLQPGVARIDTAFNAAAGADRGERGFGTQLSIAGGKPVQNNYRLDGVSVTDYANGGPGNVLGAALGVDAVQEFSVITSNYSAEYGRTSGGVVNAITRSGTNAFHGSALEFIRNSALDARNFFDVNPDTGAPQRSPFRRNQFGGSAGGPIKRDKTFIFGDYEGLRQAKGVAKSVPVPSNAARAGTLYQVSQASCTGVYNSVTGACQVVVDPSAAKYLTFWPQAPASRQPVCPGPNCSDVASFGFAGQQVLNEDFFTIRVDHKFSMSDSIYGTFFYDNSNFSSPDALDQVLSGHHINRHALILEETHVFSPALVNSVRFGWNHVDATDNRGISAINPAAADQTLASTPGQNAARVNVAGIQNFGGGVGSLDSFLNDYNTYQLYDDAFWTHGMHSLKIGGGVEWLHNGITGYGNPAGNWAFGSFQNFLTNVPDNFSSALSNATARNVRQTIFGLYVQDDWRLRPSLTLNLGLRYEMSTVPYEENGKFSSLHNLTDAQPYCGTRNSFCAGVAPLFSNPTLHNFEPRIGLSWDPFGDGKTAVRAGFGMFDVLPLPYMYNFLQYRAAPFYRLGAVSNINTTGSGADLNGTFYTGAYPLLASNPSTLSATYIDPHPHRNYVMQWNLNIQRQVTPNLTVQATYVGSRGVHQQFRVDDSNMNLPSLTSAGYLFPIGGSILNPNFQGGIRSLWWNANSFYDALQTSVTKRLSHGFQVQGSFTWGKSIDNSSAGVGADSFGSSLSSLHWYDPRRTRAISDFNVGRILSISATWEIPGPKRDAELSYWLLGGWQVGGILTVRDGMPVTPLIGGDPLGQGSSDPFAFPDRLSGPGCSSLVNPGNVNNYIKPQCFGLPMATSAIAAQCQPFPGIAGTCANLRGNAGRNIIIGPGFVNLDFPLIKNIPVHKISETFNIQFRAEFFNILNKTNFQAPTDTNTLFDGSGNSLFVNNGFGAGSLDATAGDSREIQFGLKFTW